MEIDLIGRNFVVNVALPEYLPSGLKNLARDPRKQRLKPACYVGRVEEVGFGCRFVKPGDIIVFERWEWQQLNLDDERLMARERDLVAINDTPMPDILVFEMLETDKPKIELYLPGVRYKEAKAYYHVRVERLPFNRKSVILDDVEFKIGDEAIIEHADDGQFQDGKGRMFFKLNRTGKIMLHLESAPILAVV